MRYEVGDEVVLSTGMVTTVVSLKYNALGAHGYNVCGSDRVIFDRDINHDKTYDLKLEKVLEKYLERLTPLKTNKNTMSPSPHQSTIDLLCKRGDIQFKCIDFDKHLKTPFEIARDNFKANHDDVYEAWQTKKRGSIRTTVKLKSGEVGRVDCYHKDTPDDVVGLYEAYLKAVKNAKEDLCPVDSWSQYWYSMITK
jgi:hypothetical protein